MQRRNVHKSGSGKDAGRRKAEGKDYKIWAVEQGEIQDELGNFDVLLLDPRCAIS